MEDSQFYTDQSFEKLPDSIDMQVSLFDTMLNDFVDKARRGFNNKLEAYLLDNLKKLGFEFSNKKDIDNFCKNRVHRISFGENYNSHEFYLDYIDEENRGTLIGTFNDKLNIKYEGNKIIATFGNQPISKF